MANVGGKLGILVGGGPAPGINSVIGAATIRACLSGVQVVGIKDGYEWIMKGDRTHTVPLTIEDTSRVHFRGGSFLGTARANPAKLESTLKEALASLEALGIDKLISIGGDDTCFSAHRLSKASAGKLRVVHVPKTIDNDIDLPQEVYAFGYQTARQVGVDVVHNLMVDARTTSRWYFVVAMGRKAGHLALGIGKAAGATLSLIPEEFTGGRVRLAHIVDILTTAIVKRIASGRRDGVVVLAEGLVEALAPEDLAGLENVERDDHGHVRIAEVDFGNIVKTEVQKRLKEMNVKTTVVAKNLGYELRCADPNPFDMEYTRDLGYCAARYVIEGGGNALISIQRGHFLPIALEKIMDPTTGRMRVRMVDIESDRYKIARSYMIRLRQEDISQESELTKLAAVANMSPADFKKRYEYLTEQEPKPMSVSSIRASSPPAT